MIKAERAAPAMALPIPIPATAPFDIPDLIVSELEAVEALGCTTEGGDTSPCVGAEVTVEVDFDAGSFEVVAGSELGDVGVALLTIAEDFDEPSDSGSTAPRIH